MKIRSGFVSNSSSSSFIISGDNIEKAKDIINKMQNADYYELDGYLYTSFISDGYDAYSELNDMCSDCIDGGHNYPYDEENFFEFEGDKGVMSVYIEKHRCQHLQEVEQYIKDKLYNYVKNYISSYDITSKETIFEDGEIIDDSPYFLQCCCEIVGYEE